MKTQLTQTYVHPELKRKVTAISGYYVIDAEERMPFEGREILYLTGYALVDTSCCGMSGCSYASVPGFVVAWKTRTNQDGHDISIVEPVRDPDLQKRIRRLIEKRENVQQVQFD